MVECEYSLVKSGSETVAVLIDTWWNVNYSPHLSKNLTEFGFNRYMVECESVQNYVNPPRSLVLIDTWWNVNMYKSYRRANIS